MTRKRAGLAKSICSSYKDVNSNVLLFVVGFVYAAMHHGEFCICAGSIGESNSLSDSECNETCNGDHFEKCGGPSASSVYQTRGGIIYIYAKTSKN